MQNRHKDRQRYFKEQSITTQDEVIPYLRKHMEIHSGMKVLEIGCGEAGNLKPFLDMGCHCTGIDISESRITNAEKYYKSHPQGSRLTLICSDIYDVTEDVIGGYDLIMMRDVIEHIPDQERFMAYVKQFLKPSGKFFLGFPPWYMPYGGHQQICHNRFLSVLPYYHILPRGIYRAILKLGEEEDKIQELMEIKDTGISIERFNRIVKREKYELIDRTYYLINPNYRVKFNLKPRVQLPIIRSIPFLRNFVTTCCYCLLGKGDTYDDNNGD